MTPTIETMTAPTVESAAADVAEAVSELARVYERLEDDDLTEEEIDHLVARRRALERLIDATGGTHPRATT